MKTVCKLNKCVGCHACEDLCPKRAIQIVDSTDTLNAVIDEKLCVNCKICENVCQVNHPIEKREQIRWLQGWSKNEETRRNSSSGGLAAELSRTTIQMGVWFSVVNSEMENLHLNLRKIWMNCRGFPVLNM